MEPIAEKPGVTFAPKVGQANAGKLRSSKDEVSIAKKQLEEKEDPTEEEIDAELLLARTSNNSKRSLQRSFGFRSKKDIAVALPGTGTAGGVQK
uniref:Uncharacterized protein n=1 Tax=Tetradesmus obliquus TaxID=3088 RepID=A0A383W4T4_TETOB